MINIENGGEVFETIVSHTITWETGGDKSGGYTNDPDDKGGETKWGISDMRDGKMDGKADIDNDNIPDKPVKNLTYQDAIEVYKKSYWNILYSFIPDPRLTFKLFDMSVLMGKKKAIELLQKAVYDTGKTLKIDGSFGAMTLTAINALWVDGKLDALYDNYIGHLKKRIFWIATLGANRKYKKGWLRRIDSTLPVKDMRAETKSELKLVQTETESENAV